MLVHRAHTVYACLVVCVATTFTTSVCEGQTILATVQDARTGQPLQGALVTVRSQLGTGTVAQVLSNAVGRLAIVDLSPGTYVVEAEMIGYASQEIVARDVELGATTTLVFALEGRAIELEGLTVRGEERCAVAPEEGLRVAEVWDEIQKALRATKLTDASELYRYELRAFSRDVEASGRVVRQRQRIRTTTSVQGW